jgi:hypothetical protein
VWNNFPKNLLTAEMQRHRGLKTEDLLYGEESHVMDGISSPG